jgi:hypothetical protein
MKAPGLAQAFARALARDQRERYDSVADFCAELMPYFGSPRQGVTALGALCNELTSDLLDEKSENVRETTRELRAVRQERRSRRVRPARGARGWVILILALLAFLAATTALLTVLTPALVTQLFGDKRLAIGLISLGALILISMILLLVRAASRRKG